MPQNPENTKTHKNKFEPLPEEWEIIRLGYLINFNVLNIGKGIKRFVL